MAPVKLVQILQLTDSFFPVGAFAYSDGLETAATSGKVHDGHSLKDWTQHFLANVFVPCDGLALLKCMRAMGHSDFETLCRIDEELTAIKPALTVRNSSRSIGKRLLAAYADISAGNPLPDFRNSLPYCNAAVAYAVVFSHSGVEDRDALLAFGYSRLAGIVSSALRLISLGQHQAQKILSESLELLPNTVDQIFQMQDEPLRSFNPLLDIEQMNHRYIYSKLFRS